MVIKFPYYLKSTLLFLNFYVNKLIPQCVVDWTLLDKEIVNVYYLTATLKTRIKTSSAQKIPNYFFSSSKLKRVVLCHFGLIMLL